MFVVRDLKLDGYSRKVGKSSSLPRRSQDLQVFTFIRVCELFANNSVQFIRILNYTTGLAESH